MANKDLSLDGKLESRPKGSILIPIFTYDCSATLS